MAVRQGRSVRGVVTISASYGAGGGMVGPRLAHRLGLRFVDRAIPVEVAQRMAVSLESVLAHDERTETGVERFLHNMAHLVVPLGPDPLFQEAADRPESYRESTEAVLRDIAATTGGVVLGRAGMVVLGSRPDALCVRLSGPPDARVAQAMRLEGIDEDTARQRQQQTDRARDAYLRTLYGARPDDVQHYHLVVDTTAIDLDTCVDILERAARSRLAPA